MTPPTPRDPKRIDKVLAVLRDTWYTYPDMRLGQIVVNAAGLAGPASPFYVEDDDIITGLQRLVALMATPGPETSDNTGKESNGHNPDD